MRLGLDRRLLIFAWLALVACGAGRGTERSRSGGSRGRAEVGGEVVSTVDGDPITVGEVERLARAGLSGREALRRLQAERILMAEAMRRDFRDDSNVVDVARQAQVQALLEQTAREVVVSDAQVRQAYEKNLSRFTTPERRESVHVLARLPKQPSPEEEAAAKAFAEQALPELASAEDLDAFIQRQRQKTSSLFKVVSERIRPMDAKAPLAQPYLDALFSIPKPGVVAQPVRTIYGWHAVRVTQILPKESTPYDEAAATLRSEMLLSRRRERVQQLIETLRAQHRVQITDNVGRALARLEL
jgi:parvulin-like peptidyl-prolyl isomerase